MSDPIVLGVQPDPATNEHYVYIYRDERGRVRYVGYRRETDRASSHLVESHNPELNAWLATGKPRIEIAGPFASEEMGRAVETALISSHGLNLNKLYGPKKWQFRPLGVPEEYAERVVAPELDRLDFLRLQGSSPCPVLFVIINNVDFDGDRVGYNPATPPTNRQLRERLDRWWQLKDRLADWTAAPARSPGLLVGIYGSPGRQTVIASARIDQTAWHTAEVIKGGKIRVPLEGSEDLDACSLRGRRVAVTAGLSFNSFGTQLFMLLQTDGTLTGGRKARK